VSQNIYCLAIRILGNVSVLPGVVSATDPTAHRAESLVTLQSPHLHPRAISCTRAVAPSAASFLREAFAIRMIAELAHNRLLLQQIGSPLAVREHNMLNKVLCDRTTCTLASPCSAAGYTHNQPHRAYFDFSLATLGTRQQLARLL
jgi:hypothetical protein